MTIGETQASPIRCESRMSAGATPAGPARLKADRAPRTNGALRRGDTPSLAADANASDRPIVGGVSDSELSQFVVYALARALAALGEPDPETALHLSACEARRGMRALFGAIPAERAHDPTLQREYQESILFQNLSLGLAFDIVAAVQRYARAREPAV